MGTIDSTSLDGCGCRKAVTTMVKMATRCAKELAPSVIYIGECEKVETLSSSNQWFQGRSPHVWP